MGIHDAIATELTGFGGHLVCTECHRTAPLDDVAGKLRDGWPKCCGYTMRWVTARQLAEGKPYG